MKIGNHNFLEVYVQDTLIPHGSGKVLVALEEDFIVSIYSLDYSPSPFYELEDVYNEAHVSHFDYYVLHHYNYAKIVKTSFV